MDLYKIAEAYANKVVDSMSFDELRSAAFNGRYLELHDCGDSTRNIDKESLIDSLVCLFDGDTDRVREFMVANGANDSDAEKMIAEFMQ